MKNSLADFKNTIDSLVDAKLDKRGITRFISAKVTAVNPDGTINVYLPPDTTNTVSNVLNKTGETLSIDDSVELCTKNGKLNNSWVALKHGTNTTGGGGEWGEITGDIENQTDLVDLINSIILSKHPVGSIEVNITGTNPSTYLGGTWVAWGTGRVPVGVDINDDDFDTVEKSGGHKTHILTVEQMPNHNHVFRTTTTSGTLNMSGTHLHATNITAYNATTGRANLTNVNDTTGGDGSHNNLQPYITCYMWKRTA